MICQIQFRERCLMNDTHERLTLSLKRNTPWSHWLRVSRENKLFDLTLSKAERRLSQDIAYLIRRCHYKYCLSTLFPKRNKTSHGAFQLHIAYQLKNYSELHLHLCQRPWFLVNMRWEIRGNHLDMVKIHFQIGLEEYVFSERWNLEFLENVYFP